MDDAEKRVIQEFGELQEQVLAQSEMHQKTMHQERMLGVQRQRAILTKQEIVGLPADTKMFKSIGRAYFGSAQPDVVRELDERAAQLEADMRKTREQREAIERKMGDMDSQLRELLKHSPSLVRRLESVNIRG